MEWPWERAVGRWDVVVVVVLGGGQDSALRDRQAPVDRTDFAKGGSMQWVQASSTEPRSVGKEGGGLAVQCRAEAEGKQ